MVKHTFKILWNGRSHFISIFIEQLLVFIILMLCVVSVSESIYQYSRPGLPDTEDVVSFGYMYRQGQLDKASKEQLAQSMDAITSVLKQNPNVISVFEGDAITPYMRPDQYYPKDSVSIGNKKILVNIKSSDENGLNVLKFVLKEGEWLPTRPDGYMPVVITQDLADQVDWDRSVGKKITTKFGEFVVVGVIEGMRNDAFTEPHPTIIFPMSISNSRYSFFRQFCARVKPGYKAEFSGNYYKEFKRLVSIPNIEPLIHDMSTAKKTAMLEVITSITFKTIPTVFLLIFAFVGTFGLFWLYSQKRTSEFALRMALGSTRSQLTRMVMIESLTVTITATIPGLLLAIFIYKFTSVTYIGITMTFIIMILFSAVSTWYPAYSVSKIKPAEALHYE
ncbi:MAG: ABC transporter permease [Marinifilaceae bacterium]